MYGLSNFCETQSLLSTILLIVSVTTISCSNSCQMSNNYGCHFCHIECDQANIKLDERLNTSIFSICIAEENNLLSYMFSVSVSSRCDSQSEYVRILCFLKGICKYFPMPFNFTMFENESKNVRNFEFLNTLHSLVNTEWTINSNTSLELLNNGLLFDIHSRPIFYNEKTITSFKSTVKMKCNILDKNCQFEDKTIKADRSFFHQKKCQRNMSYFFDCSLNLLKKFDKIDTFKIKFNSINGQTFIVSKVFCDQPFDKKSSYCFVSVSEMLYFRRRRIIQLCAVFPYQCKYIIKFNRIYLNYILLTENLIKINNLNISSFYAYIIKPYAEKYNLERFINAFLTTKLRNTFAVFVGVLAAQISDIKSFNRSEDEDARDELKELIWNPIAKPTLGSFNKQTFLKQDKQQICEQIFVKFNTNCVNIIQMRRRKMKELWCQYLQYIKTLKLATIQDESMFHIPNKRIDLVNCFRKTKSTIFKFENSKLCLQKMEHEICCNKLLNYKSIFNNKVKQFLKNPYILSKRSKLLQMINYFLKKNAKMKRFVSEKFKLPKLALVRKTRSPLFQRSETFNHGDDQRFVQEKSSNLDSFLIKKKDGVMANAIKHFQEKGAKLEFKIKSSAKLRNSKRNLSIFKKFKNFRDLKQKNLGKLGRWSESLRKLPFKRSSDQNPFLKVYPPRDAHFIPLHSIRLSNYSSSHRFYPQSLAFPQRSFKYYYKNVRKLPKRSAHSYIVQERAPCLPSSDPKVQVPILGLFDISSPPQLHVGGRSELFAAQLALQHINRKEVIPGHTLAMYTNNTKCDSGSGVDAFFHAIYTCKQKMVMLLGSACSEVTESLAQVVPYWNIVQISFGSDSPVLSDRLEFPLFFRTAAPDSSHNAARLAFLLQHNWTTVTTISENHDIYTLALNELVPILESANITLQATVTLDASDSEDGLLDLKEKDCRIFVASYSPSLSRKVFCQAYHMNMFGQDYAWILSGRQQDVWWNDTIGTNCTKDQLLTAVEGAFLVTAYTAVVGDRTSVSDLTNKEFEQLFENQRLPMTQYVSQTYDAVWAIALTLRKVVEKFKDFDSSNLDPPEINWGRYANRESKSDKPSRKSRKIKRKKKEISKDSAHPLLSWERSFNKGKSVLASFDYDDAIVAAEIRETMQHLSFHGISGPVSFSGPDRVGITAFYQIQKGVPRKVALYLPEESELIIGKNDCTAIQWPGGEIPVASRVFMLRVETVSFAAVLIMSLLACLGIVAAFAFLFFNLTYRKLKCIKLSSPRLNNATVVGCILVYAAVILLGLDHATLPGTQYFPLICTARAYLLSTGFSLAFGSMFTKTYRVHQIFTRSKSAGVVKNKLLKDKQLITLVMVLLIVDVIIVSVWVAVDPMTRHLQNLTLEFSPRDRGVVYQPQVEVCFSTHRSEWLGALYVYKGLLVAVGLYMAWETRHVKIPALNDSKYIGVSVYNVVITSVMVITAAHIIREQTTLAYVLITTLIFTSTTATLCILFIPKILIIWRNVDEGDPIVESLGLRIQSNTRRLVSDDKRERFHRAEIQNRVFKSELGKLEQEILRLRKKLETLESQSLSSQQENGRMRKNSSSCSSGSADDPQCLMGVIWSNTRFLRSDDTLIRKVKRAQLFRSLHRSLPSLTSGIVVPDCQFPKDYYSFEDHLPPSVIYQPTSESGNRCGPIPSSPHPLQKARIFCPPRELPSLSSEEDEGIVDLRYTLNFSTPLLTAEMSDFLCSPVRSIDRKVSFLDNPLRIDVSPVSARVCSSTDIRLQLECPRGDISEPVVEYKINDFGILVPPDACGLLSAKFSHSSVSLNVSSEQVNADSLRQSGGSSGFLWPFGAGHRVSIGGISTSSLKFLNFRK